jgi:hypothetical protein
VIAEATGNLDRCYHSYGVGGSNPSCAPTAPAGHVATISRAASGVALAVAVAICGASRERVRSFSGQHTRTDRTTVNDGVLPRCFRNSYK